MKLTETESDFQDTNSLGGKQDEKLDQPEDEELLAVTRPLDKGAGDNFKSEKKP